MLKKIIGASLAGLLMTGIAHAQTFPDKPVTIMVPTAAGGPTDSIARLVAEGMSDSLGQPVVVENREAGGGVPLVEQMAEMEGDGYSVLMAPASTMIFRPLMSDVAFDTMEDFEPVILLATLPTVLVVNSSLGVDNVEELVALAKEKPGELTYASASPGSASHLSAELMKQSLGIDVLHIPYRGPAQASTALLAGEVDMFFSGPLNVLPYLEDGTLKALFTADTVRNPTIPDVPSAAEAGAKDVVVLGTFGLMVPAGTPDDVIQTLYTAARASMTDTEGRTKMNNLGFAMPLGSPDEFGAYIASEYEKWQPVIEAAQIRIQ